MTTLCSEPGSMPCAEPGSFIAEGAEQAPEPGKPLPAGAACQSVRLKRAFRRYLMQRIRAWFDSPHGHFDNEV